MLVTRIEQKKFNKFQGFKLSYLRGLARHLVKFLSYFYLFKETRFIKEIDGTRIEKERMWYNKYYIIS